MKQSDDQLPADITRRDFLNTSLIGTGAALLGAAAPSAVVAAMQATPSLLPAPDMGPDWYGYGGVGDYQASHGNTPEMVARAHALRDGLYDWDHQDVLDTGEVYDLVVVGAGLAGLSAVHKFLKTSNSSEKVLILENHPIFGGGAKRNEFEIDGHRILAPQASNGYSYPHGDSDMDKMGREVLEDIGIPLKFEYPDAPESVAHLKFLHDDYNFQYLQEDKVNIGYFFDEKSHGVPATWSRDPWGNALKDVPIDANLKAEFLKWRNYPDSPIERKDFFQWLDSMTYEEYLVNELGMDPKISQYCDPILASGNGGCASVISAFSAFMVGMPGFPGGRKETVQFEDRHSFPGGNDALSRSFVRAIMPDVIDGPENFEGTVNGAVLFNRLDLKKRMCRMRLNASVIRVEHETPSAGSDHVRLMYVKDRRLQTVRARSVIMATGSWINKHVVSDIPAPHREAMNEFVHTSVLVANVGIKHWRFLKDLGITAFRWWDDLGFSSILKQPMHVGDYRPPFDPDKPAVLSFYIPLYYPGRSAREQGLLGRHEMLGTSFADYETKLRNLMDRLFGNHGFDHETDITGIVLNRWGHAYVMPPPGFFFGKAGKPPVSDVIRTPHGRITFAHSELQGAQFWRGAVTEGRRAAGQVREML